MSLLKTIKSIYRNTKISTKFTYDSILEPIKINKGVRHGFDLCPILFNVYINKISREFKIVINKSIQITNRKVQYSI